MTEETDAIAVIVSEETGAISMAVGGKIERDLSVEHLRELLSMELRRYMSPVGLPTVGPPSDDTDTGQESPLRAGAQMSARRRVHAGNGAAAMMSFLRRWVLHNFWLKVLSLVLARGCGWRFRRIRNRRKWRCECRSSFSMYHRDWRSAR